MGRHDYSATNHQAAYSEEDAFFGPTVEVCRGLIKEKEGCISEEGPRQGYPLPLPRRQTGPFGSKLGLQPVRECGHDALKPSSTDSRLDFVVGGVGSAEAHIVSDGASEEMRSLRDPRHLSPPRVGVEIRQVDAAHAD